MTRLGGCAMLLLLGSFPAYAQVTSISTSNPAPKGQNPDKVVCEVEQTTGSRLGARKVCKTAAEWMALRQETRENVEKVQQQATSTGIPAG